MRRLILVFYLLLFGTLSYAQPLVLSDPDKSYLIFEHSMVLMVSPGQKITIDSLLLYPKKYHFVPVKQKPFQPDNKHSYWFKIDLTPPLPDNYFLRFFYPGDMLVRIYEVDKNRLINSCQVDFYGVSTQDLFQRSRSILPLKFQQRQTHTLYFFLPNMDIPNLHVGLMSSQRLTKDIHYQDLLNGLFCGFTIIITIYSLLLGIRLSDRDNILYAIWAVVSGLTLISTYGDLLEFPGNWAIVLKHNYGVHVGINTLFQLLFIRSFLQLKQRARWLYWTNTGLSIVISLATVTVFSVYLSGQPDLPLQRNLGNLSAFSTVIFGFLSGTTVAIRGYRPGLFHALGSLSLIVFTSLFVMSLYGVFPFPFWNRNALFVGHILEIIFYLLGLTYKVNLLKKHQDQAIQEQLRLTKENQQLIETQNRVLEEKVEQRTAELQESLTVLQSTQAQLIQKEKLASLGELTAGIAHEIQNPLNFVNNFSEVSTELVKELREEREKENERDEGLEDELLDDLTQNLEKITLHGKRAGAIVRGMLEHSRASTGERTPTDLNALADEYLRLAYHGLRAKNNAESSDRFNCQLITDFDTHLPTVSVVAQDMGRVLLNLYNNAFYAVQERAQKAEPGYEPTVWVSTRQEPGQVVLCVRDNGGGIPEAIREKIFQPFFTTKPTGEGTGLGLSLSYDIITKGHGGTMAVESVEGEGAEIVITLPC